MILLLEHVFDPDNSLGNPRIVAIYDSRDKAIHALKMSGYTELDMFRRFHHEDPRRLFVPGSIFYSLKEDFPFNKYDFPHRWG